MREDVHLSTRPTVVAQQMPDLSLHPPRLDSVDLLRGLVMIIMALDHVRDLYTNSRFDPLDLAQTTVPLALTRWITHFCAPVFVFLAGTGAFLSLARGKTSKELSRFLLTRGIWLVILELTFVRLAWLFNFDYSFAFAQVIWAIGWSMVVLSALVRHRPARVASFGIAMMVLHNFTDGIQPGQFGSLDWVWVILHAGGPIQWMPGHVFFVAYPLIPWIGVMAAGYGFGALLKLEPSRRRIILFRLGIGLTAGFVLLRWANLYGDPAAWTAQRDAAFTVLSFINCQKYPPSLLYLLMTLGPAIALLPVLDRWKGKTATFVTTFGRIPMAYYLIHLFVIHGSAMLIGYLAGYDVTFMVSNVPPWAYPSGYGFSLPIVYAVWAAVIVGLYPFCRWYAGVKRRNRSPLLSYL